MRHEVSESKRRGYQVKGEVSVEVRCVCVFLPEKIYIQALFPFLSMSGGER